LKNQLNNLKIEAEKEETENFCIKFAFLIKQSLKVGKLTTVFHKIWILPHYFKEMFGDCTLQNLIQLKIKGCILLSLLY